VSFDVHQLAFELLPINAGLHRAIELAAGQTKRPPDCRIPRRPAVYGRYVVNNCENRVKFSGSSIDFHPAAD